MSKDQTEADFLQQYDPKAFDQPICTVDTVIFTVTDGALHVLLVQRANHPFKGHWALAGGFIDTQNDNNLESAAKRKLQEKTGVTTPYLEQFGTIGNLTRDPRGWSITTVYFALIPSESLCLTPGAGAEATCWARIEKNTIKEHLAFDHHLLLTGCLQRLRDKVLYTSLPVHLMPPSFSLGDLQKVYEIIMDTKLEHKSFRRRMLAADILEETGEYRHEARRPAMLYRVKEKLHTHYFVRTLEGPNATGREGEKG